MVILPLAEETVQKLEPLGYRRTFILKERYPRLPADVLTVSFSGWPIFVHAKLPDDIVRDICIALDERKHLIPWQGEGPLPLERMCRDSEEAPLTSRCTRRPSARGASAVTYSGTPAGLLAATHQSFCASQRAMITDCTLKPRCGTSRKL